ncbi:MAG: twin-arginine translocase TatA/TatE family subunit [Rickettsiales bacterium]
MGVSFVNVLIILFIILILFGAGKLPKVLGDLGKGIKNFKDALNEEDSAKPSKIEEEKPNDKTLN